MSKIFEIRLKLSHQVRWRPKIVKIWRVSSLPALYVVVTTTSGATNDEVIITTILGIHCATGSGPRLNIKTVLSKYGDFHVKDKTADRTSYL